MNTNNTNNWKQEQPLSGEPAFIDGTAGQRQIPGEPQFVTGNEHLGNLTPLYADQTRPDPYHPLPQHDQSVPLYGENQKPIYADQVSGTNKLYPGQENFLGKQLKFVDGKEVLTTGGVVQAAYVPPSHGEEHKTEHVHLSPDNQHASLPVEHLHLKPTDEHVHLTPDAERIHLKLEKDAAVEQVIRIKPDGQVVVTTEKLSEDPTEHLKERHDDTHHHKEHDDTRHHKEHDDIHHHKKEHDDTHRHKKEHIEKEKIKTKKVSKKKSHSPRKSKHDVAPVTETTTIVKVSEHEPGTAGYDNAKEHDDTHHSKKEHDDSHHGKKEHVETHHSKKEHDDTHRKKEHVETHHHIKKEHDDTHHHGKKEHVDTHKEVKSRTTTSD